jgi:hypothetical protein
VAARRPYVYLCGVSKEYCTGMLTPLNHSLPEGTRSHSSTTEAFRCAKNSLLAQGYTQVDARAYQPPGGGPIRVLTKKIRFGGKMRNGKEGTRNMPHKRGGGICFSC